MTDELASLLANLKSTDENVRVEAAEKLKELADPRTIEPLIEALGDSYWEVRRKAAEALGKLKNHIKEQQYRRILDGFENENENSGHHAIALGKIRRKDALNLLLERLNDKDEGVRINVAEALGELGFRKAVKPLINSLRDKDSVCWVAAIALGKIGGRKTVTLLIKETKDADEVVRQVAAFSLGEIGNKRAVKPLLMALSDKTHIVRHAAAVALGKINDIRAFNPLVRLLQDKNWEVRKAAAGALGKIKDPRAVEQLIKSLGDGNSNVREASAVALKRMGEPEGVLLADVFYHQKDERIKELADHMDIVEGFLDAESHEVIRTAARALTKMGKNITEEPFKMVEGLNHNNWRWRRSCVAALGELGKNEFFEPLIDTLLDHVKHVRESALLSLRMIVFSSNLDRLRELDDIMVRKISEVDKPSEEFIDIFCRIAILKNIKLKALAEKEGLKPPKHLKKPKKIRMRFWRALR